MATACVAVATSAQAQRTISVSPDGTATRTWVGLGWNVRDPMIEPPEMRRMPVVRSVVPCSPAHYAGLEPGDLLLTVNGKDARLDSPFEGGKGTVYRVEIQRGGKQLTVAFQRVERPENTFQPVNVAPVGRPSDWNCPGKNPVG